MLDSPGVLFSSKCSQADLVLRNCIKLEHCEDPVAAVHAIVGKCPQEQLMQLYKISEYGSADEFVSHVAHKRGKIKKGGVPNLIAAARTILKDWTTGFIPYYTLPPTATSTTTPHDKKEIVSGWAKEFDLDSVQAVQDTELAALPSTGKTYVPMEANQPLAMVESQDGVSDDEDNEDDDEEEDGMADEEGEASQVRLHVKSSKAKGASKPQSNPLQPKDQQNLSKKKQLKKATKQKKRDQGDADAMDSEDDAMDSEPNKAYDFAAF